MGIPTVEKSQRITLERFGDAPLAFSGFCIAEESAAHATGKKQLTRKFWLALYRTDSGKYVVSIQYRSDLRNETEVDFAQVCQTPADVRAALAASSERIDKLGIGYPALPQYEQLQASLMASLRVAFNDTVGRLLSLPEFVETI
jgi:hypothetical protein